MHDVLIIGAGPAGLSAARWCDELGLDTLVLEHNEEVGGQLLSVHNPIENYLGMRAQNGLELRDRFADDIKDCDFDLWTSVEIETVDLKAKHVTLKSGEELQTIALILATGLRRRNLGIAGAADLPGAALSNHPRRKRPPLPAKTFALSAVRRRGRECVLLGNVCPTVTLVHGGKKLIALREFAEQSCTHIIASRSFPNHACCASWETITSKRWKSSAPTHSSLFNGRAGCGDSNWVRAQHRLCSRASEIGRARLCSC